MDEQIKTEVPVTQEVKDVSGDDIMKKMNDMLNLNEISELINDNEKVFDFEGVTYRIKRPNYSQRQEVYKKRIEKYIELLKDKRYLLEKDLKALYLERGIDIDSMDLNMRAKIKKRDDFMIKLGEEIKKNTDDSALKMLKEEIDEINSEIQKLSFERTSLLEISIEQQLAIFIYTYFVFVLAEKKDGENWIKVWNTYDDFMNSKQELINRFSYYVTVMIGSESL